MDEVGGETLETRMGRVFHYKQGGMAIYTESHIIVTLGILMFSINSL